MNDLVKLFIDQRITTALPPEANMTSHALTAVLKPQAMQQKTRISKHD